MLNCLLMYLGIDDSFEENGEGERLHSLTLEVCFIINV